jgi:NADPH-dependent F420 reductase
MSNTQRTLAVLGGTGHEGSGIAFRAALTGWKVVIGSRDAIKAAAKADELNGLAGSSNITGAGLVEAAQQAAIVVLAVPYAAQVSTADVVKAALEGKVLIDVTVPLRPPKVSVVQLPAEGSCTQALQKHLGTGVRVVSAFQNVSAHALMEKGKAVDCDVLVCSDDAEAKIATRELITQMGLVAIDAGPLANSVVSEALTSVLIHLNKTYKVPASGIRITGLR